ncbi:MAG: class I SAM-dependent methyltransferase [Actinobacteria bacterium]|nr:class I SAM-dependent methyltransferase [Actinomycetota bacterium]
MSQSDDSILVARYKGYYRLPDDVDISADMVLYHWSLERELTRRLLTSAPDERWETFEECYTRLYSELPWLNQWVGQADQDPPAERFRAWSDLLGAPPKSIYEVGSGHGGMLRYLVSVGYRGKATEITRERSGREADEVGPLEWGATDGVHLDEFESPGSWDYVVSNQVIEHLHPDDLVEHLRSARAILVEGGEYILSTPHRYRGPADVSALFGADVACGMHLMEYTYREMSRALKTSGYGRVRAVFGLPRPLRGILGPHFTVRRSKVYLGWVVLIETVVGLVPSQRIRRRMMRYAQVLLGPSGVWIAARR